MVIWLDSAYISILFFDICSSDYLMSMTPSSHRKFEQMPVRDWLFPLSPQFWNLSVFNNVG